MNVRTRSDMIEVTYTPIGGDRTRLRFEPAETTRWGLHESRWSFSTGKWRPIGTVPVRNLALDVGGARRQETMTDADPWTLLDELEHAPHYTVWFAVLELEADGVERINSTPTREKVAELTGEIRTRKSILIYLERLTEAGVLESSERAPRELRDGRLARRVQLANHRPRATDRRGVRRGVGARPRAGRHY